MADLVAVPTCHSVLCREQARHSCLHTRPSLHRRQTRGSRRIARQHANRARDTQVKSTAYGVFLECDGILIDTHREGHREAFNRAFTVSNLPERPLSRNINSIADYSLQSVIQTCLKSCQLSLLESCCTGNYTNVSLALKRHHVGQNEEIGINLQEMGLDCCHWSPTTYHDLLRCGDGSAEGLLTAYFETVQLLLLPCTSHHNHSCVHLTCSYISILWTGTSVLMTSQ